MDRAPGWDYSSLEDEAVPHTPEAAGSTAIVKGKGNSGQGSFSQASKGDFYPDLKLIAHWKSAGCSTLRYEAGHMLLEASMQAYADMLKGGGAKTEGEKHFAENMKNSLE